MTGIRITIRNLKLVVRVRCWGGEGVQVCRLWGEKKKEERRWEKLGPSSIGERPVSSERETTWQSLWVMWGHPGSLQGKRRGFCGSYLGSRKEWLTIWWCFWRNVKKALLSGQSKEGGRSWLFQKDFPGVHSVPEPWLRPLQKRQPCPTLDWFKCLF